MPIRNGKNLGLPVSGTKGQDYYTDGMRQWRGLDRLVQCTAMDKDLLAPPATPADGDTYIIYGANPTGAWAGKTQNIASWSADLNAWEFSAPNKGWSCWVQDENLRYIYSGAIWVLGPGQNETLMAQASPGSVLTGTTAETVLATVNFAAGAMKANGAIRLNALFSLNSTMLVNKTCRVRLGGTIVQTFTTTNAASLLMAFLIRAKNSQTAQIISPSGMAAGTSTTANTTTAVDMTQAQALTITGQMAVTGDTVTLEGYTVELINP